MEPAQNLQKAPDHLSAAMKAWWADVLARHGVPDSHRLYLLEAACGAWDRLEGARQTLAREGITWQAGMGRGPTQPWASNGTRASPSPGS